LDRLAEVCGAARSSVDFLAEHPDTFYVDRDDRAVLMLLALDGYALGDNYYLNSSIVIPGDRSRTARDGRSDVRDGRDDGRDTRGARNGVDGAADARTGGHGAHDVRDGGRGVRESRPDGFGGGGDRGGSRGWRVLLRLPEATNCTGDFVVGYLKRLAKFSEFIRIEAERERGSFLLTGHFQDTLRKLLSLHGSGFAPSGFRHSPCLMSVEELPCGRGLSPARRNDFGGGSPRGRLLECDRLGVDVRHRRDPGSRFDQKLEQRMMGKSGPRLAGHPSRFGSGGDGGPRKVAATTGVSRGFRASPVTPSPLPYSCPVKKEAKRVPDPELPGVTERLARLKDSHSIMSRLEMKPKGTFAECFAKINSCIQPKIMDEMLAMHDEDDAPHTTHVWSGLMYMEGGRTLGSRGSTPSRPGSLSAADRQAEGSPGVENPAHCNGFVVVKQRQPDAAVMDAIEMLPTVIDVQLRVGWDSQKHLHLLNRDAVVFMVRSSREVEGDEANVKPLRVMDGQGRTHAITPINSQKNLLGMLENLRNKQRIGVCRYTQREPKEKRVALCIPPSAHAFEKLGVPWRFRDMAGHDTVLLVVGKAGT
jgi:hypothetical protein